MESVEKIREQFPITKNKVFLNHAAQSPLPKPVADAVHRYVDDFSDFGATSIEWNDGGKPLFAKLINAKTCEIAFVENTSVGLNIAANMLSYPRGSKIVTTDLEYPSVVYPWLRKSLGVKVHYVRNVDGKILLEHMEKAVDDKTVAVAVSHVEYVNGFRHDLGALSEIAHEHGAFLIVDAMQSAGAMRIDVKKDDVDFLTSGCYKWLLGPPGAGYLYVKENLIEGFEPPFVGWASVKPEIFETIDFWDIWSLRLSETASRFEVGSPSFISLVGATEALTMLLDFGIENVERRILSLTSHLVEELKALGLTLQTPEEQRYRSGIVNFKIGEPQEVAEKLKNKGIVVSARAHGVRVSPHFYNTEEEIDRLIEDIKVTGGQRNDSGVI
ncbi:aminotransferase class V-fold PLP-dependent enzyme [Candidatus Bathyarchaeota archaeon]|nr:aminotransferase class V-fold PLP-dependent enzyme [Candidatus Bathyarchaeota archaeon]